MRVLWHVCQKHLLILGHTYVSLRIIRCNQLFQLQYICILNARSVAECREGKCLCIRNLIYIELKQTNGGDGLQYDGKIKRLKSLIFSLNCTIRVRFNRHQPLAYKNSIYKSNLCPFLLHFQKFRSSLVSCTFQKN